MHTFGQVNAPKSNRIPIFNIPAFTVEILGEHMNSGIIVEMNDAYYRYKGSEQIDSDMAGDFIRVKENNDIIVDLIITHPITPRPAQSTGQAMW